MHSPLARTKVETGAAAKIEAAAPGRSRRALVIVALVIAAAAIAAYIERRPLHDWLFGPSAAATILVSGNIEAHQAVLGFKTVQSRIVELPFDEGQWVDAGTLIARLDDSDYRQQVAINARRRWKCSSASSPPLRRTSSRRSRPSNATPPISNSGRQEYERADVAVAEGLPAPSSSATRPMRAAAVDRPRIERDQALRERRRASGRTRQRPTSAAPQETLKLSQIVLGYTVLRAPFAGVIQVRQAELGEIMVPGHAGGDARRSRSRLAARLHQRDRHRQSPLRSSRRRSRPTPIRARPTTGRVSFISVQRRIHAEERRDACGARDARLSHPHRHLQSHRMSWCPACRRTRRCKRLPPGKP